MITCIRPFSFKPLPLCALLFCLCLLSPAQAAFLTVNRAEPLSATNFHTLTEAVAASSQNDTIALAPGVYSQYEGEVFPINIFKSLTITALNPQIQPYLTNFQSGEGIINSGYFLAGNKLKLIQISAVFSEGIIQGGYEVIFEKCNIKWNVSRGESLFSNVLNLRIIESKLNDNYLILNPRDPVNSLLFMAGEPLTDDTGVRPRFVDTSLSIVRSTISNSLTRNNTGYIYDNNWNVAPGFSANSVLIENSVIKNTRIQLARNGGGIFKSSFSTYIGVLPFGLGSAYFDFFWGKEMLWHSPTFFGCAAVAPGYYNEMNVSFQQGVTYVSEDDLDFLDTTDYRIGPNSALRDITYPILSQGTPIPDIDGERRPYPVAGKVDAGRDEYHANSPPTPTYSPTPPLPDYTPHLDYISPTPTPTRTPTFNRAVAPYLAGYWNTRLTAGQPSSLTVVALRPSTVAIRFTLAGSPEELPMPWIGPGELFWYTLPLNLSPELAGQRLLLEVRGYAHGGVASAAWPYLNVQ